MAQKSYEQKRRSLIENDSQYDCSSFSNYKNKSSVKFQPQSKLINQFKYHPKCSSFKLYKSDDKPEFRLDKHIKQQQKKQIKIQVENQNLKQSEQQNQSLNIDLSQYQDSIDILKLIKSKAQKQSHYFNDNNITKKIVSILRKLIKKYMKQYSSNLTIQSTKKKIINEEEKSKSEIDKQNTQKVKKTQNRLKKDKIQSLIMIDYLYHKLASQNNYQKLTEAHQLIVNYFEKQIKEKNLELKKQSAQSDKLGQLYYYIEFTKRFFEAYKQFSNDPNDYNKFINILYKQKSHFGLTRFLKQRQVNQSLFKIKLNSDILSISLRKKQNH